MIRSLVVTGVIAIVWLAAPALACAPAMPPGAFVSVASEEALIVWDADAGMEHFIRRASFRTDAEHFGFLVPTPSPPELSEVDGAVFDRLRTHIAPPVEYRHSWMPVTCCMAPLILSAGSEPPMTSMVQPDVEVLSTARVAGLDATVVRAEEPTALAEWLGERGYENRPALVAWLTPYVEDGYAITAFQFTRGEPGSEAVGSMAVRMSFATEEPFYPYREPSDQAGSASRSLRVHLVAPARGFAGLDGGSEWEADVDFAAPLEADTVLGDAASGVSADLWLTSYLDRTTTRPSADLRFAVRAGEEVRPAVVVVPGRERLLPLPLEPAVLLGGGIWWWRRRKKRASSRSGGDDS